MLWVLIRIASYVVGAHKNHLEEAILMSTHNIGFYDRFLFIKQSFPLIIKYQISTLSLLLLLVKFSEYLFCFFQISKDKPTKKVTICFTVKIYSF